MTSLPFGTAFRASEPVIGGAASHPSNVYPSVGPNNGSIIADRPALFFGISPGDYATISAAARAEEFGRGETLFMEGDAVQQVLYLVSGLVKISQLGADGVEVIMRLSAPGDILGACSLLARSRHRTTAKSLRLCRALVWDAPVFNSLVMRFPVLCQNLGLILGSDLQELEERFREVATEQVCRRVASQLVRLQKTFGKHTSGGIELTLSREHLAQMTGTTVFTVSRLLSAWEARGIVMRRRQGVKICDVQSLAAVAAEEEPGSVNEGASSIPDHQSANQKSQRGCL